MCNAREKITKKKKLKKNQQGQKLNYGPKKYCIEESPKSMERSK